MRPTSKKLLALSAAASLALAACGGGDETQAAVTGDAAPMEDTTTTVVEGEASDDGVEASADDPASTLRATLTALLQEHVYLTAIAVHHAVDAGEDDPATQGAVTALDANTAELTEAVELIASVDDPDAFETLWRSHTDAYLAYALGSSEGDDDAVADAESDLETFQEDLAELLEEITDGELASDDLQSEIETHATLVTDAIDAMVDDDVEALGLVRDAARHMDVLAADLAEGVVASHEDDFAGDPASTPARTRADLTSSLQEHTHLAVLAAHHATAAGAGDDPAVQQAVSLLQSSSEDLANLVGGALGNDARQTFFDAWRSHVDAVVDHVEAAATGDDVAATRSALEGTGTEVATVLGELVEGAEVDDLVSAHVTALADAIEAAADEDPDSATATREAAEAAVTLAATLAPALAEASAERNAAAGQGSDGPADGDAGGSMTDGAEAPETAPGGGTGGGATGGAAGGGEPEGAGDTGTDSVPESPFEAGGTDAQDGVG